MSLTEERKIVVLYGSQTGCAQDVAERMAREIKRKLLVKVKYMAMDEYPIVDLVYEELVIFACSTTGQGEEPDNMKKFWKFLLRKNLPPDSLREMSFAIFGLGDSSYASYNFVSKKLYRRLLQLGANAILERGEADDQHPLGVDGTLDSWIEKLLAILTKSFSIPVLPTAVQAGEDLPRPKFHIRFINQLEAEIAHVNKKILKLNQADATYTNYNPFIARMKKNERITTSDHFQDVRHIEFDISGSSIQYDAGDIVNIIPRNLDKEVDEFMQYFNILQYADQPLVLSSTENDIAIPAHWDPILTIRKVLTEYLDIFYVPKRRYFFELLSFFAKDEMEREKLKEFCTIEGQDELISYCHRMRRTAFEVLQDFPSVKFPLDYIFDLFPFIQPRPFSISSSLKMHPNEIHITAALVNYATKMKKPRVGLCSNWLASLVPSEQSIIYVSIYVTKGTFRASLSIQTLEAQYLPPAILIGPGTGCAPMRAILEERVITQAGETFFFFGCRYSDKDFLYRKELVDYVKMGNLNLYTAFSRDQENKVYIQHRLIENSGVVWDLIAKKNALVYLSGNAKCMPADVKSALKEIFIKEDSMNEEQAANFLKKLEKSGRFQVETWY